MVGGGAIILTQLEAKLIAAIAKAKTQTAAWYARQIMLVTQHPRNGATMETGPARITAQTALFQTQAALNAAMGNVIQKSKNGAIVTIGQL